MESLAFATPELDRQHLLRSDPKELARLWSEESSLFVKFNAGQVSLDGQGLADLSRPSDTLLEQCIFLGVMDGAACFAVPMDHDFDVKNSATARQLAGLLEPKLAALVATAVGYGYWHTRHRFCGQCGEKTRSYDAGHRRQCVNQGCQAQHFPRVDPAVIMSVSSGNKLLLGRAASWDRGVYSTLAGFVEIGESFDQAVAREVFEESGVVVEGMQMIASQAWPFPSSLMVGFSAQASEQKVVIDRNELEDARWFDVESLRNAGQWGEQGDGLKLPRKDSIARFLIQRWIDAQA